MHLADLKDFDYLVLVIIFASIYFGYKKGFIESFVDFFAWVGSAIIVFDSFDYIVSVLSSFIPSAFICNFVSSVGAYIALVVLISILGIKVIKLTSKVCGSTVDKVAGGSFGAFRGFLIAVVLFWSLQMALIAINDTKTPLPTWLIGAKSSKVLQKSADGLFDALTSEEERKNLINSLKKKSDILGSDLTQKNNEVKKSIESSEYFSK